MHSYKLFASILAVSTLGMSSVAFANSITASCAGLFGVDKATCEWKAHKAFMASSSTHSVSSATSSTVTLPSCARLGKGMERTTCEIQNQKTLKAMAASSVNSVTSPSSASSSSVSSKKSCTGLHGQEMAQCRKDMQKKS